MNNEVKLKVLQNIYANVLAESVYYFENGDNITLVEKEKRERNMKMGKILVEQFTMNTPKDVFRWSAEIFDCADWEVNEKEKITTATVKGCRLCNYAKKLGAKSPCKIYCLNPMEGMVKGIDSEFKFEVLETLWNGEKCTVKITK